jgi:cell division protein FtsW
MIYSLLAVYSSSVSVAYLKHGGNTSFFLRSQLIILALSLGIIVLVHYLPYRIYYRLAGIILLFSIVLLALTFVFGVRVNDAVRAINIPGVGRLQSSDVAKLALVIYLARVLGQFKDKLNDGSCCDSLRTYNA